MSDLRADILMASDLPTKKVYIPEWGCDIWIRTLTGKERDAFEASIIGEDGKANNLENLRARFAVLAIGDSEGKRIFKDSDAPDLAAKSAAALDKIMDIGKAHNRMAESFDVEELAKNSESAPSESIGSG